MKKKHLFLVLVGLLVFLLGGCGDKMTADKHVGDLITSIKKEDASALTPILEDGITEENDLYVLQFPEELKKPYLDFLQNSLNAVEFEINGAKKVDDERYSVQITFTPLDVAATTNDICDKYLPAISSSDLTAEVSSLLEKASRVIDESPVYEESTQITLEVKKKDKDSFYLEDEQLNKLLSHAILNAMTPYDRVCEILDAQDYLNSCLNALFKGDVAQYAKHTSQDETTVLADLDTNMYAAPDDLGSSYIDRYKAALKGICNGCQYSVGTPKKQSGIFNYVIDVTVTPNTSLLNVFSELENGTYYSESAVDRAFVEAMERYAGAPTYGEQTTVTVSINFNTLSAAGQEDAELTKLIDTILPTE